jgi:NAD(P)-dependent dehydrogenase (short-subunit alcohol dehydrogenase family)
MTAPRPLAIVTGARRGIGAAIAIELAGRGFDLALTDIAAEGSDDVVTEVARCGGRAVFYASDLAEVETHAALIEHIVAAAGPVTCLVNNAGVSVATRGDLLDVAPASFDRVNGINARGTFFMTQAVARHMAAADVPPPGPITRSIITVSSVSAESASIERGEYCLSKASLPMLTRLFALRLAPLGVGVFEVRPGIIRTPMTAGVATAYDERIANGLVPMRRWGEAGDVARAVATLASGGLGFSSGSVLHVDGALAVPRL